MKMLLKSRMVRLGGAVLLAGSCALSGGGLAQAQGKPPIKIGVLMELTGVYASSGVYGHKSVTAYAKAFNAKGGMDGHPIELIVIDNQSKPDLTVAGYRKLVNDDKVHAVVCCGVTALSLVIKPFTKQLKVPTFASGQAADVISPPDTATWIFRPNVSQESNLRLQLESAKKAGVKNVALMGVNNAYGTIAGKLLTTIAPEYGLTVTGTQFFEAAATDVKAQLSLLQATKPDAIIVWAIGPQATLVAKNAQELAIKTKVYHSMGAANTEFIRDGGTATDGNYVSASIAMVPLAAMLPGDPGYLALKEYSDAWIAAEGRTGDDFGRTPWEAMSLLAAAIKAKKPDLTKVEEARSAIRDGIEGIRNFQGLVGTINMSPEDHSGIGMGGGQMLLIKNGRFTVAP